MFSLAIQGSPRKSGNTSIMVLTFLEELEAKGAKGKILEVYNMKIMPCVECGACVEDGFCPIEDDMQEIYGLLRSADLVIIGTPIFFYGPTAPIKALIDRSQALWARKYVLGLTDPGRKNRKGFLLTVGATKGKNLFEGVI